MWRIASDSEQWMEVLEAGLDPITVPTALAITIATVGRHDDVARH
ncbi:hypothetical protein [Nocardia fluminea]